MRHLWLDLGDLRPVVPDHLAQQLARQIAASNRHAEALRLCIDGSLPPGKVWQAGSTQARWLLVRRRALGWFSRLTIWDMKHNNGVLIHLLLAERSIKIVTDRALTQHVLPAEWQAIIARLSRRSARKMEDGRWIDPSAGRSVGFADGTLSRAPKIGGGLPNHQIARHRFGGRSIGTIKNKHRLQ